LIAGIFGGSGFVAPCTRVLSNSDLSRRFVHRTSDRSRSEVLCTHGGQPSELVQSPSENDSGLTVSKGGAECRVCFESQCGRYGLTQMCGFDAVDAPRRPLFEVANGRFRNKKG